MPSTRAALRLLTSLLVALAFVPLLGFTFAQPWHVDGRSMEPALRDGSMVLVDAVGPQVSGYARGDIVVVPVPEGADYPHPILVKRIVAVAGDHVVIAGGIVTINGSPAMEPYLAEGTVTPIRSGSLDVTVPAGAVFVMGDHRENSYDSKAFGPVRASSILGRAWLAIAPEGTLELPPVAAGAP